MSESNRTLNGDILLFESLADCCGCGACQYVCPKEAIEMYKEDFGAIYPRIKFDKCIKCEKCVKSCAFKKHEGNASFLSFAGASREESVLLSSTSGGIFSEIAKHLKKTGFYICGSKLEINDEIISLKHSVTISEDEIDKFKGSKYAQSSLTDCFQDIEKILKNGEKVFFAGTPCQVASIKNLFHKYENQLFTVDIVCHGTPSVQLLNDYINSFNLLPKKILFRDKKYGWTHKGSIITSNESFSFDKTNSSYYYYFMKSEICRESCYKCPFASYTNRPGDITLGDFWGIKKSYPQFFIKNGGQFNPDLGISCILINTSKGKSILSSISENCIIKSVNINDVVKANPRLIKPSSYSKDREMLKEKYLKRGYIGIEKEFKKIILIQGTKRKILKIIPKFIIKHFR